MQSIDLGYCFTSWHGMLCLSACPFISSATFCQVTLKYVGLFCFLNWSFLLSYCSLSQVLNDNFLTYNLYWMHLYVSSPAHGSLASSCVRYCAVNFTGSMSPTEYFSSWRWQFVIVWTPLYLSDYCVAVTGADTRQHMRFASCLQ